MNDLTRVPIPTPFSVGQVNCYCFTGNGLTVLDPGPDTEEAHEELRSALDGLGFSIADIERILVTHPHIDHFGMAHRLVEESGAGVYAATDAVEHLSNPDGILAREQAFFGPFLHSMGMPGDAVDTVIDLPEPYTDYREPVNVTDPLSDGDVLDLGVELTCVSTPGHAPGSICFLALAEATAFTGDHVLPDVTPNPLLTIDVESGERTRSLPTYLNSLRTLLEYDVTFGYGGHGEPMPALRDRCTETLDHHRDRKERIAGLLEDRGTATAYDLMKDMFPHLPATEMFSGMSEIIGHLDLLEDEGRVDITETDGKTMYELLDGSGNTH